MSLPLKTLARKALRTSTPLVMDGPDVTELKQRLTAWLAGSEDLQVRWEHGHDRQNGLLTLGYLSTSRAYRAVTLKLSALGELWASFGYSYRRGRSEESMLPVGSIDELLEYCRLLRQALAQKQGQQAKEKKVRNLQGAAILARVRDWARQHRFDFTSNQSKNNLVLNLRFDDKHIVEMTIPFARFDELLPKLEANLPLLRELIDAGVSTHVRLDYARYVGGKWTSWKALGADESADVG